MSQPSLLIPLHGGISTLGEYYIHVFINGQRLRLQVDTGSSSIVVVGEGCRNCTSRSMLKWNSDDIVPCDGTRCASCFGSSSACGFSLKYGDDTPEYDLEATGVVINTPVQLKRDEDSSGPVYVYLVQHESGLWPTKVDGIFGLAFPRLNCNPTCFDVAWSSIAPLKPSAFDICFGDKGGLLRFYRGHTNDSGDHTHKITLDVLGSPKTYYTIETHGLAIANHDNLEFDIFGSPSKDPLRHIAVVDTGTTLLIIPRPSWNALVRYMQTRYCHLDGVCEVPSIFDDIEGGRAVCLTSSPYHSFPVLALVLENSVLRLPPQLYFVQYEKNIFCLGIQPGPVMIIGDAVLRGFTVSFDSDSVTFSTIRDPGCGDVAGLASFDHLIVKHPTKIGYIRGGAGSSSIFHRLVSLTLLLVLLITMIWACRKYMRRRSGYTPL